VAPPSSGTSPLAGFLNPDGVLIVDGDRTLVLDEGPYEVTSVCVQDSGRILVRGQTTLRITGTGTSVVAGGGIGSASAQRASIVLEAPNREELYVLVANKVAPVDLALESPGGSAHVAITGRAGLNLVKTRHALARMTHHAGYGATGDFPGCFGAPSANQLAQQKQRARCAVASAPAEDTGDRLAENLAEPGRTPSKVFAAVGTHQFVVPRGVSALTVEAWGGGGGGGSGKQAQARGGGGAFARATIAVKPGDRLRFHVASGGASSQFPGFGNHAGGGGGASLVTRGDHVLLVAAGGGGAGADGCSGCREGSAGNGGPGGAAVGLPGESVSCHSGENDCAAGGEGGSQQRGGRGAPARRDEALTVEASSVEARAAGVERPAVASTRRAAHRMRATAPVAAAAPAGSAVEVAATGRPTAAAAAAAGRRIRTPGTGTAC